MSNCADLTANATAGVAPALRAVDCLANEATASAFANLFGGGGALLPALTILLTLYIAFFAISLLTGRSRIGISALTPRMMTLGLVLTFVTSWVAYQSVVWNLAVGAPDQVAGAITGANGSATQLFADRIDIVLAAIAEPSQGASAQPEAARQAASGAFTPESFVWLGALLLMLGTVGVLVTARIALAVLLAIGPVFVVLGLFNGTRGLFVGWLRGVVMTSVAPLFAVVGGGFMLELAVPVVAGLNGPEGLDIRAAMAFFLVGSVHVALMIMIMRVIGTMVSAWTVFGLADSGDAFKGSSAAGLAASAVVVEATTSAAAPRPSPVPAQQRTLALAGAAPSAEAPTSAAASSPRAHGGRTSVTYVSGGAMPLASIPRHRPRGIGSRFRPANSTSRELMR